MSYNASTKYVLDDEGGGGTADAGGGGGTALVGGGGGTAPAGRPAGGTGEEPPNGFELDLTGDVAVVPPTLVAVGRAVPLGPLGPPTGTATGGDAAFEGDFTTSASAGVAFLKSEGTAFPVTIAKPFARALFSLGASGLFPPFLIVSVIRARASAT